MTADGSDGAEPVWNDRPWPPLPALRGPTSADVCVVGLGGSGLAAIHELLGLGVEVVGLDAGRVGGAAAGRNAGFFTAGGPGFHHHVAAALGADAAAALYRLTLDELHRIWSETPQAFSRTGVVRLAADQTEVEDCRSQLRAMEAAGLPVRVYAGPDGHGLLFPLDGAGQPLLRCRLLASRARMLGARLHESSRALEISGTNVRTPAGEVRCGAVVVAVDGGLEQVLPELTGRVRTARLQALATAPAPEVDLPRPTTVRWGLDYWHQTPDKRVVLGGFRDTGGEREWTHDARPTDEIQQRLDELLRVGLGVRAPVTHRWAGCAAFTDDGLPVFAEVRRGVWAVGAYSGSGNVLGAVCGRAAGRQAVTGASSLDAVFALAPPAPSG